MYESTGRTVRPYLGVLECQKAFDRIVLRVGAETCENEASIHIQERAFRESEVSIHFTDSNKDFSTFVKELKSTARELDFSESDLVLLAVATSPYRRLAEVVFSKSLSEMVQGQPRETIATMGDRPEAMSSAFHGFTFTVYLCLARTVPRRPLRPSRKGTWLARASFRVGTDLGDSGFQIEPLTDVVRDRYGLEPGVIRYVELEDPTNPAINDADVTLYVDEALLTQLAATPDTPGGLVIQRQLGLDVATAIVYRASVELARHGEAASTPALEGSILDRILERAARNDKGRVEPGRKKAFLEMVANRPQAFVAEIESWMSPNRPGARKLNRDMRDLARGSG